MTSEEQVSLGRDRGLAFAYVNPVSKSGRIWRHSPQRPNYLGDPVKEIDFTAYGTWPSVLDGEMIPLSFLEFAREGIKYDQFAQKIRRFAGFKTHLRNIGYLDRFDLLLVVADIRFLEKSLDLLRELRRRGFQGVIFGSPDFNLGRVREFWRDESWYRRFVAFAELCDVFIPQNRASLDYYRLAIRTPVAYVPQPFPYHRASRFRRRRDEKEKSFFIAGGTDRLDTIASCLVAAELQRRHPEYLIEAIGPMIRNRVPLASSRVKWHPNLTWDQFLAAVGRSRLLLNLDAWWTKGRVPTDAAAVGTPCIGINADSQMELFPDLTCADVSGVPRAIELAERLMNDDAFYDRIAASAADLCATYDYAPSRERILQLADEARKRKGAATPAAPASRT